MCELMALAAPLPSSLLPIDNLKQSDIPSQRYGISHMQKSSQARHNNGVVLRDNTIVLALIALARDRLVSFLTSE